MYSPPSLAYPQQPHPLAVQSLPLAHPFSYPPPGQQQSEAYVPEEELLVAPVADDCDQMAGCSLSWQLLSVSLHRAANLGFGIAISGGRDNPHFTSGDPAIIVSDVINNGPAWGLLQVNDRILSANGVSFENIEYAAAVEVIKSSQQINMIVKRRVAMPVMEFEQRTLKFTLTKSRKKDDFGIVVGCKFYIKEIRNQKLAEKDPGLREGDAVLRINGQSLEGATLEDVNKWLERSREKLCLVIQRDVRRGASRWPSENTVYERVGSVSATPRHSPTPLLHQPISTRPSHEYINSPRWRSESADERRVSSPALSAHNAISSSTASHPLPLEYEYYNRQTQRVADQSVRTVAFRKVGGSVGVRVIGGNQVGIFVSAVAGDSPAALHGVCCGDRILEVNGRSMQGVTREAAVQLLLSLDDRINLRLRHDRNEFEHVRNNQLGDHFFIRAHFSKEKRAGPLELSLNDGDIFQVTDTLFGGTVGLWQAARVYSANANKGEPLKGVIPNQSTAETIAREQRRISEQKGKGTLLRRKLDAARKTKSLPKNMLADPAELCASIPLPAYERVALTTPSFHRPVVLFGPLADVARQMLLSQFSMRFAEPEGDGGVIRLSSVDQIMASGKHCVLDISIESVERLQLAQYAPIVILIDVDGRSRIRELRKKAGAPHVSSRKLSEQAAQIKKHHPHLLSATVDASQEDGWFEALRDLIAHLQTRRIWSSEFPINAALEDVLLFPLSTKSGTYDSDMDSLKGDYGEMSRRDESVGRPQQSPLSRSILEWDRENPTSLRERESSSLTRRSSPPSSAAPTSTHSQHESRRGNPTTSPGYYHVKQLLNDETLYDDAKLANQIANLRLQEEAKARDERMKLLDARGRDRERDRDKEEEEEREEDRSRNEVPLRAPIAEMYSPREDRDRGRTNGIMGQAPPSPSSHRFSGNDHSSAFTSRSNVQAQGKPNIAPKPNVYGQSVIRNKWSDSDDLRRNEGPSNGLRDDEPATSLQPHGNEKNNRSISPNTATISLNISEAPSLREENGNVPRREMKDLNGQKDEEPNVVEETSAIVTHEGAVLSCPQSKVQLRIPKGAIVEGEQHEIYVKVCREGDAPPIDKSKGETLLSPLVMCGPQGLSFLLPCELRLPHCASLDQDGQWSFSLKSGEGDNWQHLDFDSSVSHLDNDRRFISVPISHF